MIVEFAGMPGTGKTTVCAQVVARLVERGVEVGSRATRERAISRGVASRGRPDDWLDNVALELRHPDRIATALRYMASFSPVARRGMLRPVRDLLRKSYLGDRQRQDERGLFVLDQGMIQPILSISILRTPSPRTAPALRALLRAFEPTLPDVVVRMNVDPATGYQRLIARLQREGPSGRFDRRLQSTGASAFETGQRLTEHIVDALANRGRQIIECNANQSIELQAQTVADALYRIHRSHHA